MASMTWSNGSTRKFIQFGRNQAQNGLGWCTRGHTGLHTENAYNQKCSTSKVFGASNDRPVDGTIIPTHKNPRKRIEMLYFYGFVSQQVTSEKLLWELYWMIFLRLMPKLEASLFMGLLITF
jgi:hypothetical protein